MSTSAKVATNILLKLPSLATGIVEKQFILIFTSKELILYRNNKNGETKILNNNEISDFTIRDGMNKSLVIEFIYKNEKFSFYTYKDFSALMQYVADNLVSLQNNNFYGLLK